MDQILKDVKKYKFYLDDSSIKAQVKDSLMGICDQYVKYIKKAKPTNAYSLEDIEIAIDKMLKIE